MKRLKLSLRLFETYVAGFLKEMGYVSASEKDGVVVYSITRTGLMYLIGLLAADPDVWLRSRRISRDVARELREYGCSVRVPGRIVVDEGFEIMCDLLVSCSRETYFPVFIAPTDAMFILKRFLALLASRLTNVMPVVVVPWHLAEKMTSREFAGERFIAGRGILVVTYYNSVPAGVAASIVRTINRAGKKALKEVEAAFN
jgi:hypothetical protein